METREGLEGLESLEGLEVEGSASTATTAAANTSTDVGANASDITYYPYYPHSLAMAASYVLAYFSIFLLCMVGNILVCLIVVKNRRMRTVINLFILNLAISDLLVGIFCIPTTLVDNLITGQRSSSKLPHTCLRSRSQPSAGPACANRSRDDCQEGQFPRATPTLLSAAEEMSSYMHCLS